MSLHPKNAASSHYELVAGAFSVVEIAQPLKLRALPSDTLISVWERFMELDVKEDWCCLVQDENHIYGYLTIEDPLFDQQPLEGTAFDEVIRIAPEMMVPASLPLLELVPLFDTSLFYFLLARNTITHVVSFYDLDKLPFKFCLFSLFMQLESQLIELFSKNPTQINEYFSLLSEQRRNKARDHCRLKYKGETPFRLLLCTTFVDKKEILMRSPNFQDNLPFHSKGEANSFFSKVEFVRNQIAHSDSVLQILQAPVDVNSFISNLRSLILAIGKLQSESLS